MNIIESNIPDISKTNIEECKLKLSNKIINKVKQTINELEFKKTKDIKKLESKIIENKQKILESKSKLESLSKIYNKRKKTKDLLGAILKIHPQIFHNKTIHNEIVILLKVMDRLNEDQLNYHILEIQKLNRKNGH